VKKDIIFPESLHLIAGRSIVCILAGSGVGMAAGVVWAWAVLSLVVAALVAGALLLDYPWLWKGEVFFNS